MPAFLCVYAGDYRLDWPGHVFPVEKYRLLRERLLASGAIPPGEWAEPEPASREELLRVHSARYLDRLETLARERSPLALAEFEAPLSSLVLDAVVRATGGTILAARHAALSGATAVNLGGGFHHAFADRGEGFCFVNDVAVAIRDVSSRGLARRVAVVDCDVHQGNGTASIFEGDENVFTFSIHQENLYPVKRRSTLDVGLPDGAGDALYLLELDAALDRIASSFRPDLAVYLAGADPFAGDQLGGLSLTKSGLLERDRRVFGWARASRIGIATCLAGGYARRTQDVVDIHEATVLAARASATANMNES